MDVSQIGVIFPILGHLHLQKLLIVAALAGMFLESERWKNVRKSLNAGSSSLLYWLIFWIILSVPFGVYPSFSLNFLISDYWKILLSFLMFLAYISSEEDLNKVIWVSILAVSFLATIVVINEVSGRAAINNDIFDANDTAFLLVLGLPYVFWKYYLSKGIKKNLLLIACLIILLGIVKTDSRGGFLGLSAISVVIFMHLKQYYQARLFKFFIALFFLSLAIFFYGGDEYLNRLSTMLSPSDDYNISSTSGRLQIWLRGLDMMVNNPFLGVGVMGFISADGLLYADAGAHFQAAHNSFVQIGAELGFPGLIVFILLIYKSIKKIKVSCNGLPKNTNNNFRVLGLSIFASWVGYVVCGFFLSAAYVSSYYMLLSMSFVFLRLSSSSKSGLKTK